MSLWTHPRWVRDLSGVCSKQTRPAQENVVGARASRAIASGEQAIAPAEPRGTAP